ncbi:hypothetical protein GSH05_03895 [Burkholderia pseudomallei]|uniref:Uncharacterized protein n=6 Tax=Burkholderia pseudomallei TaxID=28450 RepID=Q3JQN1_BURP1|nr:hypothetical protein BURPS1710b_2736 [Burkholderia pseudomallei 1710b]AUG20541.1 hypothetical protein CXQ84_07650 [Burkholderia pseudomallei]AYE28040.1 hypothetical protein CNX72_12265 [Burkholderia pseudomallei]KGC43620.1 hypothetical protein DO73_5478 [Burkholderia pseudomallei]KGD43928.1 hypothetical protein DO72_5729 [Burkholderia pseudomallei]
MPDAPAERGRIMRKTISMYWPLAIVVPLAAAAYLYLSEAAPRRAPAVARDTSAELARAVSYGFVDDASQPLPAASHVAPLGGPKAL